MPGIVRTGSCEPEFCVGEYVAGRSPAIDIGGVCGEDAIHLEREDRCDHREEHPSGHDPHRKGRPSWRDICKYKIVSIAGAVAERFGAQEGGVQGGARYDEEHGRGFADIFSFRDARAGDPYPLVIPLGKTTGCRLEDDRPDLNPTRGILLGGVNLHKKCWTVYK